MAIDHEMAQGATERIYEVLREPLVAAISLLDALEHAVGAATSDNVYLHDSINECQVFANHLRAAIGSLLHAAETVRA